MVSPAERDRRVKIIGILGFICFLVSLYLIKDHYEAGASICDAGGSFSCSVVNRSAYSELLGVPVAIFGAIWCAVIVFGAFRVLRGVKINYYLTAILLWSFLGVLFIVYMVIAEIILGAICPFCTVIHILTLIIFYYSIQLFRDIQVIPEIGSFIYNMRYVLVSVFIACMLPIFVAGTYVEPPAQELVLDLASCVTSKHIKMFGADSCGHCQHQKKIFGESFAQIEYIDCYKTEEGKKACKDHEIQNFPTWVKFDASGNEVERVKGVQSLEKMEIFSGCKMPEKTNEEEGENQNSDILVQQQEE